MAAGRPLKDVASVAIGCYRGSPQAVASHINTKKTSNYDEQLFPSAALTTWLVFINDPPTDRPSASPRIRGIQRTRTLGRAFFRRFLFPTLGHECGQQQANWCNLLSATFDWFCWIEVTRLLRANNGGVGGKNRAKFDMEAAARRVFGP